MIDVPVSRIIACRRYWEFGIVIHEADAPGAKKKGLGGSMVWDGGGAQKWQLRV